jgi:WD40 repeat protein
MIRRLSDWFLTAALILVTARGVPADPPTLPLPAGAKAGNGTGMIANPGLNPRITPLPPDYTALIATDGKSGVRRYDVLTNRSPHKNSDIAFGMFAVSADGKRAVIVREQNPPGEKIYPITEVTTGKDFEPFPIPKGFTAPKQDSFNLQLRHVSLSANGKILAAAVHGEKDFKGMVIVWDVDAGAEVTRISTSQRGIPDLVLSPDGKFVATWGQSVDPVPADPNVPPLFPNSDPARTVRLWDVKTGIERFQFQTAATISPQIAAFSPDSTTLAIYAGGTIDLFNAKTSKPLHTLLGRYGQGAHLVFSPDGKTLASINRSGIVQRWAVADGKLIGTTERPDDVPSVQIHGAGFADNDRLIVWATSSRVAIAWEVPSQKVLTPLSKHTNAVHSLAFTSDGKELITAGSDGQIFHWDAGTCKSLGAVPFRPMPGEIRNLTLSTDGTRGITKGTHMLVFDLVTGEQMFAVPGAPIVGGASTIHVTSSDFNRVATLTFSGTSKLGTGTVWDLKARRKLVELELPKSMSFGGDPAATFSPSGERLITATFTRENSKQPSGMIITSWGLKTGAKLADVEVPGGGGRASLAAVDEKSVLVFARNVRGKEASLKLTVIDYTTGKLTREIDTIPREPGGGSYGPIVFNSQRTLFAVGGPFGKDGEPAIRIYEWPSGKPLHTFVGHTLGVSSLAFSPDGKTLASGAHDSTILLWDLTAIPQPK